MIKMTIIEGNSSDKDNVRVIMVKGEKGDTGDPTKLSQLENDTNFVPKNEIDAQIDEVNVNLSSQIRSLASGSPLVASSVSGMTDTSKVYVNTADGYWYYYNGSSWVAGGVYQSTGLGEKSVSYINESDLLRNLSFRKINADDIIWRKGDTIVNGKLVTNYNTVCSQLFLAPKGTVISTSNAVQGKVTEYYLNKTYKTDSGGHRVLSNYVLSEDCYVRITLMTNTATAITYEDGNSTNVQMVGIVPINNGTSIVNSLKFNQFTSAYYYSDRIYVKAGTKIKLIDDDTLDANGDDAGSFIKFAVREAGQSKVISGEGNYGHTDYTVQNSGFVQIFLNVSGTISDYHLSKIKNIFSIELNEYEPLKSTLNVYIGDNNDIDIKEYSGGNIAFKFDGNLYIYNQNSVVQISWDNLKAQLSDNIIEIENEEYIKIPSLSTLNYNLHTNTFYISAYNFSSKQLSDDDVVLLANASSNVTGGYLLDIYVKNQAIKGDPERLTKQLFNSAPFIKNYDWKTQIKRFSNKLKDIDNLSIESFIFFTDTHLIGSNNTFNENRLQEYMGTLQKIYNSSPVNFIVSGGDWLTSGDSQEYASMKLGYIDGFTKNMFKNLYHILGNHDTNYQGKLTDESEANTGQFDNTTLINLLFRKYKSLYYSFNGENSKNYVLDTGIDWNTSMNAYRWGQIDWLANKLIEDNSAHSTVMMHIIWNTTAYSLLPFTDNLTKLIDAFNNHTSITLNNITYDFSSCTGHVDYVLGGHLHSDYSATINNVLCIATTTFALGQSTPTFDMIINDYDNHKAYFIRIGDGEDREFNI